MAYHVTTDDTDQNMTRGGIGIRTVDTITLGHPPIAKAPATTTTRRHGIGDGKMKEGMIPRRDIRETTGMTRIGTGIGTANDIALGINVIEMVVGEILRPGMAVHLGTETVASSMSTDHQVDTARNGGFSSEWGNTSRNGQFSSEWGEKSFYRRLHVINGMLI